jgi:hypothetical protein
MIVIPAAKQKVFRLQVPMADLLEVEIFDDLDHLPENLLCLLLRQFPDLIQPVEKFTPLAETE